MSVISMVCEMGKQLQNGSRLSLSGLGLLLNYHRTLFKNAGICGDHLLGFPPLVEECKVVMSMWNVMKHLIIIGSETRIFNFSMTVQSNRIP